MPVYPLQCRVQHYLWGSTHSIPALQNKANPKELPWAELWMGAHDRGCSILPSGQHLSDFIAQNPEICLGQGAARWQNKLPFLFKILAADSPLSIQCHPNAEQAKAGFAAEEKAGIAIHAVNRNYRDTNHKPELIVALEEFWAFQGFRPVKEIRESFARICISGLAPWLDKLDKPDGVKNLFAHLLSMPRGERKECLQKLKQEAHNLKQARAHWAKKLLEKYPDDIGCTAILLLNLIKLETGQALYLKAGELHAYLQGTGLEVMANSDNVLRGGLTPKHVDKKELLRILHSAPEPPQILHPTFAGHRYCYQTPAEEFLLSFVELENSPRRLSQGTAIFLSLEGDSHLRWSGGNDKGNIVLAQGQAAFCTADTAELEATGKAKLWIASIKSGLTPC